MCMTSFLWASLSLLRKDINFLNKIFGISSNNILVFVWHPQGRQTYLVSPARWRGQRRARPWPVVAPAPRRLRQNAVAPSALSANAPQLPRHTVLPGHIWWRAPGDGNDFANTMILAWPCSQSQVVSLSSPTSHCSSQTGIWDTWNGCLESHNQASVKTEQHT